MPKKTGNQGNTPNPDVSNNVSPAKPNKKNTIAPKPTGGTGKTGPATPL